MIISEYALLSILKVQDAEVCPNKEKNKNSSCLVNQTALNTWNCNPTDKAKRSHVEGSDLSPKMITSY